MSEAPVLRTSDGVEVHLPETAWLWRRLFSFALAAVCAVLLALVILRLSDAPALKTIGLALCVVIVLDQLLYVGGATLTDIWRLVTAIRTRRMLTETRTS